MAGGSWCIRTSRCASDDGRRHAAKLRRAAPAPALVGRPLRGRWRARCFPSACSRAGDARRLSWTSPTVTDLLGRLEAFDEVAVYGIGYKFGTVVGPARGVTLPDGLARPAGTSGVDAHNAASRPQPNPRPAAVRPRGRPVLGSWQRAAASSSARRLRRRGAAMRKFVAKHAAATTGTLSCFDRVLFKGHLPLGYPHAMEEFLQRQGVLFKQLKSFVLQQAERLRTHSHVVAERAVRPWQYFESPVRKDQRPGRSPSATGSQRGSSVSSRRSSPAAAFGSPTGAAAQRSVPRGASVSSSTSTSSTRTSASSMSGCRPRSRSPSRSTSTPMSGSPASSTNAGCATRNWRTPSSGSRIPGASSSWVICCVTGGWSASAGSRTASTS